MARIVMKFGGTSMAGMERIRSVAERVKREVEAGLTGPARALHDEQRRGADHRDVADPDGDARALRAGRRGERGCAGEDERSAGKRHEKCPV